MWHTVISSLPELISAGIKYTIPLAIISFIEVRHFFDINRPD